MSFGGTRTFFNVLLLTMLNEHPPSPVHEDATDPVPMDHEINQQGVSPQVLEPSGQVLVAEKMGTSTDWDPDGPSWASRISLLATLRSLLVLWLEYPPHM